jgi:hypothetical protein
MQIGKYANVQSCTTYLFKVNNDFLIKKYNQYKFVLVLFAQLHIFIFSHFTYEF